MGAGFGPHGAGCVTARDGRCGGSLIALARNVRPPPRPAMAAGERSTSSRVVSASVHVMDMNARPGGPRVRDPQPRAGAVFAGVPSLNAIAAPSTASEGPRRRAAERAPPGVHVRSMAGEHHQTNCSASRINWAMQRSTRAPAPSTRSAETQFSLNQSKASDVVRGFSIAGKAGHVAPARSVEAICSSSASSATEMSMFASSSGV